LRLVVVPGAGNTSPRRATVIASQHTFFSLGHSTSSSLLAAARLRRSGLLTSVEQDPRFGRPRLGGCSGCQFFSDSSMDSRLDRALEVPRFHFLACSGFGQLDQAAMHLPEQRSPRPSTGVRSTRRLPGREQRAAEGVATTISAVSPVSDALLRHAIRLAARRNFAMHLIHRWRHREACRRHPGVEQREADESRRPCGPCCRSGRTPARRCARHQVAVVVFAHQVWPHCSHIALALG
jgi:hypothetical protein